MVPGSGSGMNTPFPGAGLSSGGGGSPLYWSDAETCSYLVISMNVRPVSCMMSEYKRGKINAATVFRKNFGDVAGYGKRQEINEQARSLCDAHDTRIPGKSERNEGRIFLCSIYLFFHSPSQSACSLTMAKASAGESIREILPLFIMENDVPICSASHGSWVI